MQGQQEQVEEQGVGDELEYLHGVSTASNTWSGTLNHINPLVKKPSLSSEREAIKQLLIAKQYAACRHPHGESLVVSIRVVVLLHFLRFFDDFKMSKS